MTLRQQRSVPSPETVISSDGGSSQTSTAVDDHDHQEVDTTLRLAPPYYFSRKSPPPNNKPPLRWFLPGFFDGVENDVVDTTLRLCPPGTVFHPKKPQNSDISPSPSPSPPVVYDATPLRWFYGGADSSPADASTIKNSRNYSNNKGKGKVDVAETAGGGGDDKGKKKRMRCGHDDEASTSAAFWKKKRRRRGSVDEENQRPAVPIEEMGGLLRAVEARGGSRPVFLYRKKLEMSDVKRSQNRVFLKSGERILVEFLREEEATAVLETKKKEGITMVGVDGGGRVYEKLVFKLWESLEMLLINSDWNDVVAANKVEKDDVMEIWGYRENGKPCLAFNFRRERKERDGDGNFRREREERDGDGDGDGGDNGNAAASSSSRRNACMHAWGSR